jgi:sterol desaturase/sphingolipid hydroxylase (fatty acid hydroxylase superfamily)
LVSAGLVAFIFGLETVLPHFAGRKGRVKHAFPNVLIGALDGVIGGLFTAAVMIKATHWAEENSIGLLRLVDISPYLKAVTAFVLFDLWMYVWHRANHRVLFLWRFHRMHHSDLEMDTTTALRFHPGEIIFSSLLRVIIIPTLGLSYVHLAVYEMSLLPVILFHHSNVGLSEQIDRIFRSVIVTPNMHRVHHSQEWTETNSNYSSIFSFWDRLNRTFKRRKDTLTISYGLRILQEKKWHRLWGMLATPFR